MKMDATGAPSFRREVELRHCLLTIRRFTLTETDADELRCDLVCEVPDNDTGKPRPLHWARFMSRALSDAEVRSDIYRELRNMLCHELAEAWHVDGVRTHDPHGKPGRVQ